MVTRQIVMLRDEHVLGRTHAEGDAIEVDPEMARALVASGAGRFAELGPEDLDAGQAEPPFPVKLRGPLFIHGHTYARGDVIILPADRARELVEMRSADPAEAGDVEDPAKVPAPFNPPASGARAPRKAK